MTQGVKQSLMKVRFSAVGTLFLRILLQSGKSMLLRFSVLGLCLILFSCSNNNAHSESGLVYASAFSELAPDMDHFTIHAQKVGTDSGLQSLDLERVRELGEFDFRDLDGRLTEKDFPGLEITLLDGQDLADLDSGDCETFWSNFREKYTPDTGYIRVSEIGFSESGSEAIFYLSGHGGCLAGRGELILMKLVDDRWIVAGKRSIWVS